MTERELKKRKARFRIVARALRRLFPRAKIALRFGNPWELLVAVQLSAQCTDKKVNEVTPALFKKYRTLADYARARPREFERAVYRTGFYRNKAKNIIAAAKYVREKCGEKLPRTMEGILQVPGIGRKSANVILGNAYGAVEGIAVDTHVIRLSRALGLTEEKNPAKIERDLMKIIPKKDWFATTYRLIDYGRKYCPARPHRHGDCPLTEILEKR